MPTNLTTHFTLEEFCASQTAASNGIDNAPPTWDELCALHDLAEVMQDVRALLGHKPITITSGFRCASLNEAVGGSTTSAHQIGLACDFVCPDFGTPYQICEKLFPHIGSLGIDQLIYECGVDGEGDEWVHLGLSDNPRAQMLTITQRGTYNGLMATA
jgi:hypothetical protein